MRQAPLSSTLTSSSSWLEHPSRGGIMVTTTILIFHLITVSSAKGFILETTTKRKAKRSVKKFLSEFDSKYGNLANKYIQADWTYNTNLTKKNSDAAVAASLALSIYGAEAYAKAKKFNSTDFSYDTKRQLSKVGSQTLTNEEMKNLSSIISEMGSIYGQAKLCRGEGENYECLSLEPELTLLLAESTNESERFWAWEGWRQTVGRKLKPLYLQYVELKNKLALVNNFTDYGDQLRQKYETSTFESVIEELYSELEPLYKELHAYIRRKLYDVYGPQVVDLKGPIPQHLLGDMWGRFWRNLYRHAVPFPDRPPLDVTEALIDQGYDPIRMFRTGEEFFTSMGLKALPSTFYNLSMLEKPNDVEVVCHAMATDFMDAKDFRIRMCTRVNFEDFLTVHHELGHVQYFMQYAHQPILYRDGANDGFHEAIGELMSMSVSTPKHLYKIGLLKEYPDDRETELNYLLSRALDTIASLPFHYVMDLWRWKVFRNDYSLPNWNEEYWKLSETIVGVKPPRKRSPEDLDPATIFHVAQDYDMIRYFSRTILQFQFAESLCEAAGHKGPLHGCDFYESKPAGNKLAKMLKMGSSKPWPDALEAIIGERKMNVRAIREYFTRLEDWLRVTNWLNNDTPGWTTSTS